VGEAIFKQVLVIFSTAVLDFFNSEPLFLNPSRAICDAVRPKSEDEGKGVWMPVTADRRGLADRAKPYPSQVSLVRKHLTNADEGMLCETIGKC